MHLTNSQEDMVSSEGKAKWSDAQTFIEFSVVAGSLKHKYEALHQLEQARLDLLDSRVQIFLLRTASTLLHGLQANRIAPHRGYEVGGRREDKKYLLHTSTKEHIVSVSKLLVSSCILF